MRRIDHLQYRQCQTNSCQTHQLVVNYDVGEYARYRRTCEIIFVDSKVDLVIEQYNIVTQIIPFFVGLFRSYELNKRLNDDMNEGRIRKVITCSYFLVFTF